MKQNSCFNVQTVVTKKIKIMRKRWNWGRVTLALTLTVCFLVMENSFAFENTITL
jgi:hypothetical protein